MEKEFQEGNLQDPLLPEKNQDLPANLQTSEDNQMMISKDEKCEEAKNSKSSENNSALQPKSHNSNHSPQTKPTKPQAKKLCMEDFDYIRTLGKGSFGEVILVQKKSDQKMYAMKAIDKNFLYKVLITFRFARYWNLFLGKKTISGLHRKGSFNEIKSPKFTKAFLFLPRQI